MSGRENRSVVGRGFIRFIIVCINYGRKAVSGVRVPKAPFRGAFGPYPTAKRVSGGDKGQNRGWFVVGFGRSRRVPSGRRFAGWFFAKRRVA